jgi:uncharacterized YceG family protein
MRDESRGQGPNTSEHGDSQHPDSGSADAHDPTARSAQTPAGSEHPDSDVGASALEPGDAHDQVTPGEAYAEDAAAYDAEAGTTEAEDAEHDLVEGAHIGEDTDGSPILITSSSYGRGYQTVTTVEGDASKNLLKNRRERRRRRNTTLTVAVSAFAVLLIAFVIVVQSILRGGSASDYDQQAGEQITFTVNEGEGPQNVATRLVDQGIVASQGAFDDAYSDLEGTPDLHAGEFPLREEMPAADALDILFEQGEAENYIAIDTGIRIDAAFSAISSGTGISESDLRQAAEDPTDFGLPEDAPNLEGYLAPGEYRMPMDATAEEILQEMVDTTQERLEDVGITDPEEQYDTIIVASLLTAEALPDDYRTIAGIIENRLAPDNEETDGRLQIDATVIYGLGQQSLQFSEEDRNDASNEYNTYAIRGLPPGPIEAPAVEAIEAASDPDENDYFYWVTTNIETGETKFAEDYEEHQIYWQEFTDYCDENPEICEGEPTEDAQGP